MAARHGLSLHLGSLRRLSFRWAERRQRRSRHGTDTLGNPDRKRIHTDDSVQWKYYDRPDAPVSKAAMTFTFDAGCEYGGGVSCSSGSADAPSQYFVGFMAYNRLWLDRDRFA